MKNLKEAKELLERYKSITLEQLTQKYEEFTKRNIYFTKGRQILCSITRFSTTDCVLCKSVHSNCSNCIYSFRELQKEVSCMDIIYKEMSNATSAEELFNAIQKRISYLTHVIEWYETLGSER